MKKYYLHNGVESSGPFDLSELEIKQITATTPVWFSGLPDWKTAAEIEELQVLLKVSPPPFKTLEPETEKIAKEKVKKSKIMGLHKNTFYLVLLFVVLFIGSFVLNILEENRKEELSKINHQTEIENRQFLLKERELKEQNERLAEQQRLEEERIAKEKKDTINKRLSEIQIGKIEIQTLLDEAKNKLIKANNFQLFRTPDEKSREINALQAEISHLKSELEILDNERNQLELELERLH
ncbi:DUF4339 domain-containing protein [Flavobacterium flavipallidum]|uniref:GYF domain-containing protein n=1 Tax=Flavobacterium flavipallidum TaxID=3139140 RepID=A0ABU9HKT5_9FLAO